MIADKRKFLGGFIMAFAVLLGLISIVTYAQGRGNPMLGVVSSCLLVLAVIVLAGAKRRGGSSS